VYGQVFLPLLEPVKVAEGEKSGAGLHADLIGTDYVWRWDLKVRRGWNEKQVNYRSPHFKAVGLRPDRCASVPRNLFPVLSEAGLAERWLLMAMDGKTPRNKSQLRRRNTFLIRLRAWKTRFAGRGKSPTAIRAEILPFLA